MQPARPNRVVHFHVHVPRCAGTTLDAHFRARLGDGFLIAPRWRNPLRLFLAERFALRAGDPRLTRLKLVSGHSLGVSMKRRLLGAEVHESLLLRDPLGYLVSLYNLRLARHRAGTGPRPPAFPAWCRGQRRNPISRFLISHYFERRVPALYSLSSRDRLRFLEDRLAGFWFVADMTRADELIAGLARSLGVEARAERQNVTVAPALTQENLDPGLALRLRTDNALDQALWERWKDRGWRDDGRAPGAPPPALDDGDRLRYLANDAVTTLRRLRVR